MSESAKKRSSEFLKIAGQFKLGELVTESSHPLTANLSEVAREDISRALGTLFDADADVVSRYEKFAESGQALQIKDAVVKALRAGGRIFFTGCGSTGRLSVQLDAIWREFWQQQKARGLACNPPPQEWENRTVSVMAGGDYALIRAVEGFEDFAEFGKKQMTDLSVSPRDVVFAITEGGETSFVIGTVWAGVEAGARVYFIYNNPDDILRQHVQRSKEVIDDRRVEKINLTTGPMSITGSTRMQATSIQLCVLLTVLEMAVRDLMRELEPRGPGALNPATVPQLFAHRLADLLRTLKLPSFLVQLAPLVAMEEEVYRKGGRVNYYADRFGLDVLTDTTERSPTYCVPPFRKFDDAAAAESWAYLFTPEPETPRAWERLLRRKPRCVEWSEGELRWLVGDEKFEKSVETLRKISGKELLRYRIGQDGLPQRPPRTGDGAVAILGVGEKDLLVKADGHAGQQLNAARAAGGRAGVIWVGASVETGQALMTIQGVTVFVPVPHSTLLLRGTQHVALKLVLNALSTCTMVRLGRVKGNYMVWVVPANLKLIDRATRYIEQLAKVPYAKANELLFEAIEHVEPRMKADQTYPPVVALAVMRAEKGLSLEDAEKALASPAQ